MSHDGSTIYSLCRYGNFGHYKNVLLVFAYKTTHYERVNLIEQVSADRFYISGDGSKLLFANYKTQELSYGNFACNVGEYYIGGTCEACSSEHWANGKCTEVYADLRIILPLTIIPALIIIALIVFCCVWRRNKKNNEDETVSKVNVSNMTIEEINEVEPRTYVFEET